MSTILHHALRAFNESYGAVGSFRIITHHGWPQLQPDPACLVRIKAYFDDPAMEIHLWPRLAVAEVLGKDTDLYGFRAFTRGNKSHIFSGVETSQSLCWIIAHELCHQQLKSRPALKAILKAAQPKGLDPASDLFHVLDPEEKYCDAIATRLVGKQLDRAWWRKRLGPRPYPIF